MSFVVVLYHGRRPPVRVLRCPLRVGVYYCAVSHVVLRTFRGQRYISWGLPSAVLSPAEVLYLLLSACYATSPWITQQCASLENNRVPRLQPQAPISTLSVPFPSLLTPQHLALRECHVFRVARILRKLRDSQNLVFRPWSGRGG